MKQQRTKRLTRRQKIFLSENTWLKPENWLLIKENSKALVIWHKKSERLKRWLKMTVEKLKKELSVYEKRGLSMSVE